ncbi:MAG: hypothetical protein LC793_04505 [Thermomicrobia bacterium]|nr:hypothetical protein [Thermomicrobia bacterium]MCA1724649.1 hypothetical protein [Thermomicrobia bacterium]
MILLTREGIETLMEVVSCRLAEHPKVAQIQQYNPATRVPPAHIRQALKDAEIRMDERGVTIKPLKEQKAILMPLGGVIADCINDELGEHVGFVLQ